MAETRNIVIVGPSFAGLGVAHYYLRHIQPQLKTASPSTTYKLILVGPSDKFFWRVGTPRALVDPAQVSLDKLLPRFLDEFKGYGADAVTFYQATATGIDPAARTLTLTPAGTSEVPSTLPYHALIITTGTATPTPATSLHGDGSATRAELESLIKRLPTAQTIIVSGGGPVSVETAGEIGEMRNGSPGWFSSSNAKKPDAPKITLYTAGDRLLNVLKPAQGAKAASLLASLGVDVVYGTKITSTKPSPTDPTKTDVTLSDGTTVTADVYIPGTGATPNSSFLPSSWLDAQTGRVDVDGASLRVKAADAGARVYAAGDVANHTRGGVPYMGPAANALGANLRHDLLAEAVKESGGKGSVPPPKHYKDDTRVTQIVPMGHGRGVGSAFGFVLPSFMVGLIKGRDYFTPNIVNYVNGKEIKA